MQTFTDAFIYPVKSCGAVSVSSLSIDDLGPQWDRHWMLVDKFGKFLSQRALPLLSQVKVKALDLKQGVFRLSYKGVSSPVEIYPQATSQEKMSVEVWGDKFVAVKGDSTVSHWFSKILGRECFFVEYDRKISLRQTQPKYGKTRVQFADGFPLFLIGSASLDFLNNKLKTPVSVLRFRPNIVVKTDRPHIEDDWSSIVIGDLRFDLVKKCSRCNMVNIDPDAGENDPIILKTLMSYRRLGSKINFGQNMIAREKGIIKTQEKVKNL